MCHDRQLNSNMQSTLHNATQFWFWCAKHSSETTESLPTETPNTHEEERIDDLRLNYLFANVMYNKQHAIHPTLPGTIDTKYHLRPRPYNFKLTTKKRSITECDSITRMLFKDVYWHCGRYIAILCICISIFTRIVFYLPFLSHAKQVVTMQGGSVAEWLACWTQAQKGLGSNRSSDAVG